MNDQIELTIQDYIEKNWPDDHNNYGLCKIGFDGETETDLELQYPHGKKVSVMTGTYWVWKLKLKS